MGISHSTYWLYVFVRLVILHRFDIERSCTWMYMVGTQKSWGVDSHVGSSCGSCGSSCCCCCCCSCSCSCSCCWLVSTCDNLISIDQYVGVTNCATTCPRNHAAWDLPETKLIKSLSEFNPSSKLYMENPPDMLIMFPGKIKGFTSFISNRWVLLGAVPVPVQSWYITILVGGFKHGFYLPFHIWDVILPIDEVHHFSRWLLHHQPVSHLNIILYNLHIIPI